jgi:actin related protein 2/3 complex subunit 1A/1B
VLLACGSCDFKVQIYSAYIKDIEEKPQPTVWGSKMPLGQLMGEWRNSPIGDGGWVHDVCFSHNGTRLAWVGHDSSIAVVDGETGTSTMLRTAFLPFLTIIWTLPDTIIAAGHQLTPIMFKVFKTGESIQMQSVGKVQQSEQRKELGGISAMRKFQSLDRHARIINEEEMELDSLHQNTITAMKIHTGSKENACKISSSSVDGQIILWDLQCLVKQMRKLAI